jgi:hypothetical protein
MTCDSMRGWTPPPGMTHEESKYLGALVQRVADLESALCGLCHMIDQPWNRTLQPIHPDLAAWYAKHKATPGCVEFEQYVKAESKPEP